MHRSIRFVPPSATPTVKPLPRRRRRVLFLSLFLLFVCAVPVFVFYATGYRYDFFASEATITATGGFYVAVATDDGVVFMNDEPVEDSRVFRSALYIQGVNPGLHRLHVQAVGYQTWVKELPVYPHMVTEAGTFQMPERPQIRLITEYQTSTGTPLLLGVASTTTWWEFASMTVPYLATTSKATTTATRSDEYQYVSSLFATTTTASTTATTSPVSRVPATASTTSAASTTASTTVTATTTKVRNDFTLYERDGDVFVRFTGPDRSIPYYYCIPEDFAYASSSDRYDMHLIEARQSLAEELLTANATATVLETTTSTSRQCRREIKIDRAWHDVISFDFYPNSTDLIVMHRTDGVYVTEVDDRAWQNSQQLYPAEAIAVRIDGGRIYVRDTRGYVELFTTLLTEL